MNNDDFSNLGKQISETIEEAIGAVGGIISDVNKNVRTQLKNININVGQAKPKKKELPVIKRPSGKSGGVILLIIGIIVAFATGSSLLAALTSGLMLHSAFALITGSIFLLTPFIGGVTCIMMGKNMYGRASRFEVYVYMLKEKHFCAVNKLAKAVKKSEAKVIKDLNFMMQKFWFKEGHLDEKNTCFMADHEVYEQYLEAQEAWKQKQLEAEEQKLHEAEAESDPVRHQLEDTIREGNGFIRQIRSANERIPGEEISKKLDKLEMVTSRIFDYISEHPEKQPDMRRFIEYYLPTTLKLVNAYADFDCQPVQGDNIKKAKQEIMDSLDNINTAFENKFDQLFQEDVMDISSDISVMSAMLAQEGLMGSDFTKKEN